VSLHAGPTGSDGLHTPGGVFRSDDLRSTWIPLLNGLPQLGNKNSNFTSNYKGFDVSPTDPQRMVVSDAS